MVYIVDFQGLVQRLVDWLSIGLLALIGSVPDLSLPVSSASELLLYPESCAVSKAPILPKGVAFWFREALPAACCLSLSSNA